MRLEQAQENIFKALQNTPMHASWRHLKDGTSYHLEFIQPMRALTTKYRDGGYIILACEVLTDSDTTMAMSPLTVGDQVIIDLPSRTFARAWVFISQDFRRALSESDNLCIQFTRTNKKNIRIDKVKKTQPTPTQLTFAEHVYTLKAIPERARGTP